MTVPNKKLNDGVMIPMLGFGTWQLEGETCTKAVKSALEIGYRHIDTAHAYYNHKEIAKAIKDVPRNDLFLTTKLWREHHDPKKVEETCNESLQELGTDYIDLYLIHWPERKNAFAEIVHQMFLLKEKGKVRSVGLCNATIHHIQDLFNQKLTISMNQIEIHPLFFQKDLIKFCLIHDIAVTAYSPIARGETFKNPIIKEIAAAHGKSPAQVSLRFLIQNDLVVIPKATSEERIRENFALFDFTLTDEEMRKIETVNQNRRMISPEFQEFDY